MQLFQHKNIQGKEEKERPDLPERGVCVCVCVFVCVCVCVCVCVD